MLTFTIPKPTPTLNATLRMHWAQRRKLKHEAIRLAKLYRNVQKFAIGGKRARVTVTRHGARTLDRDNLIGGAKHLVDALTEAGVIVDDSPEWAEIQYEQVAPTPKGERRTVVTVEPIEEAG